MDLDRRCLRCGSSLPPPAPWGACPACLLRAGLVGGSTDLESGPPDAACHASGGRTPWDEATIALGTGGPGASRSDGAPEARAAASGAMPTVLLRDPQTRPETPVNRPSSPELPDRGDTAGRYQLFGEIARGGMGAVLKGRDADLGRDLAVKVLLGRHRDEPELVRRFIEEAQISGQLQHPGIVPVYELGRLPDGRPFFAMKLVKGRTLGVLLRERNGPSDDLPRFLSIFEQVCQTMAYAHARGVVHRDLKPSNVMVGSFGEVQVMDWGLAKVLEQGGVADEVRTARRVDEGAIRTVRSGTDADVSQTCSVLGTPSYMPPEQARGEADGLDERADVFGLGAILCEILTGQPPYVGRTGNEGRRMAARAELGDAFTRLDSCGADLELLDLARRCLAADPEHRPRDAGKVALAMTTHLNGVQERLRKAELVRVEAQARVAEERKRRKLVVALAAVLVGFLSTVGGGGVWLARKQQEQGAREQAQAARVLLALKEAERLQAEAEQAGDDPSKWAAARDAARATGRQLDDTGDPATRKRVAALIDHAAREARTAEEDRRLMAALFDLRSSRADDLDGTAADAAYGAAFREAGLDPDAGPRGALGVKARARREAKAVEVAAALDDWAGVRRVRGDREGSARLSAAAREVDPNAWRNRLRATLMVPDKTGSHAALRELAKIDSVAKLTPVSLDLLGNALIDVGDATTAEAVLLAAQLRYPGDFWLNKDLGRALEILGRRPEAIRYYTVARALRPETAHHLADALQAEGKADEAIAVLGDLVRRRPKDVRVRLSLGKALRDRGRKQEAETAFDAAIKAAREEVRLKPDDPAARNDLGNALRTGGMVKEAIAEYREAIRLRPGYAAARANLGFALSLKGDSDEAVAECREAIRLRPDLAHAWCNLGFSLQAQGRYAEAVAALECGHKRGSKQPNWPFPSDRWVKRARLLAELDTNLRLSRWDQVAVALGKMIDFDPADHYSWYRRTPLYLQRDDVEGYRRHCRRMLERFGETGDPVIAERTAKACLLAPLSEPDRDAARLLAERAVTMARDRRHQVLPWALLAEALADYRGRRFEETIARADECLSLGPGPWNRDVPAHLVRAMANYRLGRIEVALAALERGAEVLRTQSPSLDGRDLATNWHDVLICEVLRGEAETLVRPPELPADPFAP